MTNTEYARETHAKNASVERLFSHTVGIANRALACRGKDPSSGLPAFEHEAPGTGVAVRWGDHRFILTAKHVLDNAEPKDLSFFARPSGALIHASQVDMRDALNAVPLKDNGAAIHRCPWEDIAIMTMTTDALGTYAEFADVANSWVDPDEGEIVVGVGFPVSNATVFGRRVGQQLEKSLLLSPIVFSGEVLPTAGGETFKDYQPDRHYLFPYESGAEGKHPRGISGAALWVPSPGNQLVWVARFQFAGICTSCYRNGTIEQVVKASVVRGFLREVFGDPDQQRA